MNRWFFPVAIIVVVVGVATLGAKFLLPTTITLTSVDCDGFSIKLKEWTGGANIEGVTSKFTFLWYDAPGSRDDKEISQVGVQELGMVHGYSAIDSAPLHPEALEGGLHPTYAGYYVPVYGETAKRPVTAYKYDRSDPRSSPPGIFSREEYEAVKKCMLVHGQELESILGSSYTDRETAKVTATPVRFVSILYIPIDKLYGE